MRGWRIQQCYLQHCKSGRIVPRRSKCKTYIGYSATHPFPLHVTQVISQYYCDIDLHEKALQIPCTSWSDKWLAWFNGFGVNDRLAQERVIYSVIIKSIHNQASISLNGLLCDTKFWKEGVSGSVPWLYHLEIHTWQSPEISCREETMAFKWQQFKIWEWWPLTERQVLWRWRPQRLSRHRKVFFLGYI